MPLLSKKGTPVVCALSTKDLILWKNVVGSGLRLCKSAEILSGNMECVTNVAPLQTTLQGTARLLSSARNVVVTDMLQLCILLHLLTTPNFQQLLTPLQNMAGSYKLKTQLQPPSPLHAWKYVGKGMVPNVVPRCVWSRSTQKGEIEKATRMYAIIDEQSNRSLAKPKFFEIFGIKGQATPYTLNTCSGSIETFGRRATGYVVSPIKGNTHIPLPTLIECD